MTDSTPTTLLDLDAVIEAHSSDGHATMPECVKCSEDASGEYAPWPCGTARLVDEVKNLRASLHLSMSTLKDACDVLFEASGLDAKYESETDLIHETVIGLRTERDAAIARAEAAGPETERLRCKLETEAEYMERHHSTDTPDGL